MNINTTDYYTIQQFTEKLGDGTHEDAIRQHCRRKGIAAEKIGNSWLIPKTELNRFKKQRRGRGKPPKE